MSPKSIPSESVRAISPELGGHFKLKLELKLVLAPSEMYAVAGVCALSLRGAGGVGKDQVMSEAHFVAARGLPFPAASIARRSHE
jgi:hypothetical protein